MILKKMFRKIKPIEQMGTISLTFKMPLISFIQHFKSHHSWEVNFNDEELDKIEKAIRKAKVGKSQDLVFEDELTAYLKNLELLKNKIEGGNKNGKS